MPESCSCWHDLVHERMVDGELFLYEGLRHRVPDRLLDSHLREPEILPNDDPGRFFVRHQSEEYVGAPQKRFAWSIGLLLAVTMFFLIVVNNLIGPINLFICLTCLLLLFFESAFGICLACKVYNLVFKEQAKLCPGNVCEVSGPRQGTRNISQASRRDVSIPGCDCAVEKLLPTESQTQSALNSSKRAGRSLPPPGADCTVPDWAVAIGHADKWKLHNNCASPGVLPVAAAATAETKPPTVEIIAMAHPPVQSALKTTPRVACPARQPDTGRGDRCRKRRGRATACGCRPQGPCSDPYSDRWQVSLSTQGWHHDRIPQLSRRRGKSDGPQRDLDRQQRSRPC